MKKSDLTLPADYAAWIASLKQRIQGARQRALLAANEEQIRLYHDIGRDILERQSREGWGAKVIDHLSADLRSAFPGMKGLSSRNLKYMKFFAQECPDFLIGQQTAAQLPWFHIVAIITKLPDPALRDWYARQALTQSWPRETLTLQIRNQLHLRQGAAVTNFDARLLPPQAGLANQILKDPYHFDFLGLGDEAHEGDIENALSGIDKPRGIDKPSGVEWLGDVPVLRAKGPDPCQPGASPQVCRQIRLRAEGPDQPDAGGPPHQGSISWDVDTQGVALGWYGSRRWRWRGDRP